MANDEALLALAALAHPTRLDAFRRLVEHEPSGLSTGQLVEASGLTQSTFSTHLAVLAKAGLVISEKRGRSMIQRANIDALRGLMLFLAKDCCQGRPELCEPLLADLPAAEGSPMPTDIIIYHNPECGTSRNALAMIRNAGIEPHVVEYLKTPPARPLLESLLERAGMPARDLLRQKGTPYAELGLDNPALSEADLLDAVMAHPILINRPLVVSPLGVKLCRPSEAVLDLLPAAQRGAFVKEDGEQVVDATGQRIATV